MSGLKLEVRCLLEQPEMRERRFRPVRSQAPVLAFLCKSRFPNTAIFFSLKKSKKNIGIDFSSKKFFHLFFVPKYLCSISVFTVISVGLKS